MVTTETAILAAAIALAAAWPVAAQERRDHDPMIEKWAAEKVSAQLGELRGSMALDRKVGEATVHEVFSRARERPKARTRIFVLPRRGGDPLPPIVMRKTLRPAKG